MRIIRSRVGWLVLVLLGAGSGCSEKNNLPSGIIAREEMQSVLWDMIQADQYSTYLSKDSAHIDLRLENLRLYDQVFQLHHLTREQFSKSYKYYMAHPDLTQTLLDSLQEMGNRLRMENYNRPLARPVVAPPPPVPALPVDRKIPDSTRRHLLAPSVKNPLQP